MTTNTTEDIMIFNLSNAPDVPFVQRMVGVTHLFGSDEYYLAHVENLSFQFSPLLSRFKNPVIMMVPSLSEF